VFSSAMVKNKFVFVATALFLVLSLSSDARSQWLQADGPYGAGVTCFASQGTNLFVGTSDGVYLTTDNGANWVSVDSGMTHQYN
jgi:hypothetical protein